MDWMQTVEKFYKNKKSGSSLRFENLLKMVSEQMEHSVNETEDKKKFSAARFYKTALKSFDAPTEQAGKLGTEERKKFQKYITRNIKGYTLEDKISSINAIAEGTPKEGAKISEIMGALGAIKMLQSALDDFNESTAGFIFEAFLSGLLQGKQVTEKVGGTLPIEDCMFFVNPKTGESGQPVSLKLLSPGTKIEGSLENLIDFFGRPEIAAIVAEKGIEYIVATKTPANELDLYSFNITPENFFSWIKEGYFNFKKPVQKRELQEAEQTPEALDARKEKWEKAFLGKAAMFGLDPRQVEFNYNWGDESEWRSLGRGVVRRPSHSAANAPSVATILLSPSGKDAYKRWIQGKYNHPSNAKEITEVPVELEQQFNSGDPDVERAAAIAIAKIGQKRLSAYFESILGGGIRFDEAPVHLWRWWYANVAGDDEGDPSEAVARMKTLVQDGSAESIMEWSKMLQNFRHERQFTIEPRKVRGRATLYGSVNVNKNQIYRTLQKYSKTLETLCAPIYEELETLSTLINGYYMQNRVGDAFKAEQSALQLSVHTKELARTEEKST